VSDYLTNLITRTGSFHGGQWLRPVLRSSSPIAGHDQRIAGIDRDDFTLVGAPPDPGSSRGASGSRSGFLPRRESHFASLGRGTEPSVQGKTDSGLETTAESAVNSVYSRLSKTKPRPEGGAGLEPDNTDSSVGREVAPEKHKGGSLFPDESMKADVFEGSYAGEEEAASNVRKGKGVELTSASQRVGFGETEQRMGAASPGEDPKPFAPDKPADSAIPDSGHPKDPESGSGGFSRNQAGRMAVHTRPIAPEQDIDSAFMQPGSFHSVRGSSPGIEGSDSERARVDQSPRVHIGRINVEVVQSSPQKGVSVSRPGPVTAESASVIGPLGADSRSNPGQRYR